MTNINNNNNNECIDIKLNEFIFNTSISIHLFTYKYNSVKDILEYSLLSKRCFKIFQNLIISLPLKFIFPINNFIKYIINNDNNNNNNNNNNTTYINQLIQYKHIETIKIQRIEGLMSSFYYLVDLKNKNNNKRRKYDNSKGKQKQDKYEEEGTFITQIYKHFYNLGDVNNGGRDQIIFLKRILNYYCPCLKGVTVLGGEIYKGTYTCDDFFKFNKLLLYWDQYELPLSNDEFIPDKLQNLQFLYEYSFSFISNLNPTKVYISSSGDEMQLELQNINNILNFKSIKSIHFDEHLTPTSFITKVFQSESSNNSNSNLQTLYLNLRLRDENTLFNSGINSNKTIKKLILKRFHQPSSMITKFLQLIKSNSTISTLGLHYFNIENSYQLSPLIQIKNINTLYCAYRPEILKIHLDHCNYNSNIKKLVIYDRYGYYVDDNEIIGLFENFIKNNNSSLEIIKIDLAEYGSNESLFKLFNDLLILNNYNNNNNNGSKHLKLQYIKVNY